MTQVLPDVGQVPLADQLHLEITGPEQGPPVLLLHGWGSSAGLMRPVAAALSDRYRVLNLDLPGHGQSPPPPQGLGVPEHAALIYHILKAHTTQPVSIVGHSNGGRVALFMASDSIMAPMIARLVLISPSGIKPRRTAAYYFRNYLAQGLKAPFQVLPPILRAPGLDWLRHSVLWRLLGSSDYRSLTGVMRETFVKTVSFFLDDRIDRIEVPTLLFWGDQDTAISRYQMSILETRMKDAGLVVLPGAGHYGYLDAPTPFLAGLRHFLDHA